MSKKEETEYLTRLRKVVAENNKLETASVNRQFKDLRRQQPTVIRKFPPIPSKEYTIQTKIEWKNSVMKFLTKSALIGEAISTGFERLSESAPVSTPASAPASASASTKKVEWTNEQLDKYIDIATRQMGKKFGGKKKNKSRKVTKPRQRTTRKRA
jgi:hypothetical protein|uniref:Uncharacterized protein n=1 Tax=viral metagenome TaxID=1070528 RepID=A0A6C0F0V3_9ZZZZ